MRSSSLLQLLLTLTEVLSTAHITAPNAVTYIYAMHLQRSTIMVSPNCVLMSQLGIYLLLGCCFCKSEALSLRELITPSCGQCSQLQHTQKRQS